MFNHYSHKQNHRGMEAPVDQVDLEVQLVPLDLEAQPARSALVCLLVLRHPEHPEVRKRKKSGFFLCLSAELLNKDHKSRWASKKT